MRIGIISLCCLAVAPSLARGLDVSEMSPMKWVKPMVPEEIKEPKYPEYAEVLDKAQMQIEHGLYRRAIQMLRLNAPAGVKRDVLLANALVKAGRFDEAAKVLEQVELTEEVALLRARVLEGMGQRLEAVEILRKYADSTSPRVHAELARMEESMGQLSAAARTLEWFAQQKFIDRWRENRIADVEAAADMVAIADGLNRLAMAKGLFRDDLALHHDILGMFTRAYDVMDRHNAEAHIQAASFFASHDDQRQAKEELGAALDMNPSHVEALLLAGEMALSEYDFGTCEKSIAAIRAVNEDHPAGQILTAQLLLMQRMPEDARVVCSRLAEKDPHNAEVLAMLAACDALAFDEKRLFSRLRQIDQQMPESSLVYVTVARFMTVAYQFKDAAKLLEVAVQRTPHWNSPRNLLSLAYMQQTNMEKARPVLEEARKLDPYNVETTNYMRLLDTLSSYRIVESEHFKVRFSPVDDPFLADEVLTYMEWNYPRLTGEFSYQPDEKTVIELMPTSEDFAVRTTGKPWLATIGASTGPVITMVAPRGYGKTNGAFDWTDVCRHEFVHTITLGATHHRIPRWFTEGLAVSEQTNPLSYEQAQLLADAVQRGRIFAVRRINWSFIRPQEKGDTSLAYVQSLWLCRYIQEQFRFSAIMTMVNGYRDGFSTEQVVQKAINMSSLELDARFAVWAKQEVKKLGMDPESKKQLKEIKEKGEKLIQTKSYDGALVVWQQAYAISPIDPLVNQRLAGLYLQKTINKPAEAAKYLHWLDQQELKDNRYALRLAKLYEQQGDFARALAGARRATQIDPYDKNAREVIARILEKSGDAAGAAKQREIAAMIVSPSSK